MVNITFRKRNAYSFFPVYTISIKSMHCFVKGLVWIKDVGTDTRAIKSDHIETQKELSHWTVIYKQLSAITCTASYICIWKSILFCVDAFVVMGDNFLTMGGGHGLHDDVIKWKHFPRYCPFVRGIHRSLVNSPHTGKWRWGPSQ